MRKVLLITCLLLIAAMDWVQAQYIRTEQYTVLIEREVYKQQGYRYYSRYEYHPDDPTTPWPDYFDPNAYCLRSPDVGAPPDPNSGWDPALIARCQDYCSFPDPDRIGASHNALLELRYKQAGSNDLVPLGQPIEIDFNSLQEGGSSLFYYDTIHIVQGFNIDYVQSRAFERTFWDPGIYNDYYLSPNFTVDPVWLTETPDNGSVGIMNPLGELGEWTNSTTSYDGTYRVYTTIRVIPAQDVTYTLPSHDKILISRYLATGPLLVREVGLPNFQYQDTIDALTNSWHDVPRAFYKNDTALEVSGYDLFGAGYVSRLNTTVNFRLSNTYFGIIKPSPVAFTLRLSSPHITSVTPTDLNCYERNEGSLKIQFDRPLLPQEKLNILLYDTISKTNYSALNLTALAADNSYTWLNELRAGTYQISLLGKYARGADYDLVVNTRVDTIPKYVALNSVSFEDGFNTPDVTDFNAYTEYTGFSQATYTGSIRHIGFQQLTQPAKIKFTAAVQNNVLCKGSATGSIVITASGGFTHVIPDYPFRNSTYKYSLKREGETDYSPWVNFTNQGMVWQYLNNVWTLSTTQVVNNLKGGKYSLRIRDEVDCYAKDIDGNEITYNFTITEPAKGITLDLYELSPITSPTAANAQVKVQISGGTPNVSTPEVTKDPYTVTFTDSATGQQIALTNTVLEANKRMQSVTALLDAGTYYLRIYDAYYPGPTDPGGCYFEMKIPIRRPDPLLVTIAGKKPISCFDSTNGKLVAKPTGGILIDSIGYTYKWYKVTNEGNSLLTDTDSLLENVAAGNYQVEVTDKYNNKTTSSTFTLTQPAQMQLAITATQASCYASRDGSLHVSVTGGTPFGNGSYTYQWSNGDRTALADTLMGGNYMVVVTDSMFCTVQDTASVTSPVRIMANAVTTPISCRSACDGQIALHATGGSGVYTYSWNTGATTATISNLCPGTYWYTVTDAGGCFDSDTIVLSNPDTLFVNLGIDRKICINQTIRLDATASDTALLTYNWQGDNGFTANTAKVAITQAGTYRVAVSNRGGCVVKDTIVITGQNSTVNTDYVVSTQAFVNETVTLVNISQPRTDSVKWLLPSIGNAIRPVIQTNDKCDLIFSDTGRYAITMQAYYASGCIDDTTKTVNVINGSGQVTTGSQSNAFLQSFGIFPNPNNGQFAVNIKFSEITKARLRLINSLTNVIVDDRVIQGLAEYHENYNVNALMSGVYILVIDAAKGSFVYKVIIAH